LALDDVDIKIGGRGRISTADVLYPEIGEGSEKTNIFKVNRAESRRPQALTLACAAVLLTPP
jgi:hypothetical protein